MAEQLAAKKTKMESKMIDKVADRSRLIKYIPCP